MAEKTSAWKFFAAFAIIILIAVAYYSFTNWQTEQEQDENRYNGYDFALSGDGFWVTRIQLGAQPYDIPFRYHPRETEGIVVHPGVTDPILLNTPEHIFIAVSPDAGALPVIAGVEISRITGSKYDILNIPTSGVLSAPSNDSLDTLVVTCEDASNTTAVIQFVHDPEANAIVRDENCVILFYKTPEESVRVADLYAYMLLRIMQ